MPLDTSSYSLALLRLDGRRWNDLRRMHAQISTQASADGSSYLEMGNTKVICTVSGPSESKKGAQQGGGAAGKNDGDARVEVEIGIAGFSGVDRKRSGRGDKSVYPFCSRESMDLRQETDSVYTDEYLKCSPRWHTLSLQHSSQTSTRTARSPYHYTSSPRTARS